MTTYTVVIADDEELTRERIASLLSAHAQFKLIGSAANGAEAIDMIDCLKPDIVFLDIKMPIATGFEVLQYIKERDFLFLIFITAHDDFAMKAFEHEAYDYLLKPFSETRFSKMMDRMKRRLDQMKALQKAYILVKANQETLKLDIDQIQYLESDDNYVILHLQNRSFKKRTTLTRIIEQLDDTIFLRVHRSFVVNVNHIKKMRHIYHGDYVFTMTNDKAVPTSRTYRENVEQIMNT